MCVVPSKYRGYEEDMSKHFQFQNYNTNKKKNIFLGLHP